MTREAGQHRTVTDAELLEIIETIANEDKSVSLSSRFLLDEWNDVAEGWNLDDWAEYRDFRRLGRKTRVGESGRRQAWDVFERLRQQLSRRGDKTMAMVYADLAASNSSPFHAVVVDERQDVSPAGLRFLCHVSRRNPAELFFAGDLGQRIFQTPFSWSSLGVDIRGRSRTRASIGKHRCHCRTGPQLVPRASFFAAFRGCGVQGLLS